MLCLSPVRPGAGFSDPKIKMVCVWKLILKREEGYLSWPLGPLGYAFGEQSWKGPVEEDILGCRGCLLPPLGPLCGQLQK